MLCRGLGSNLNVECSCGDVAAHPLLLIYITLLVGVKGSSSTLASSVTVSWLSPASCCPLVLVLLSFAS